MLPIIITLHGVDGRAYKLNANAILSIYEQAEGE